MALERDALVEEGINDHTDRLLNTYEASVDMFVESVFDS
jgi:hypothetical protein